MANNTLKKKIELVTVWGSPGYKDDLKHKHPGHVNVWAEVNNFSLTSKEARKVAKMLNKAAKDADKNRK